AASAAALARTWWRSSGPLKVASHFHDKQFRTPVSPDFWGSSQTHVCTTEHVVTISSSIFIPFLPFFWRHGARLPKLVPRLGQGGDRIPSEGLTNHLTALEGRPWEGPRAS